MQFRTSQRLYLWILLIYNLFMRRGNAFFRFLTAPLTAMFMVSGLVSCGDATSAVSSLTVYCGAGLYRPMSEAGRLFEEKYRVPVRFNFGGSNTLLAQMQLAPSGDVYVPASFYYLDMATEKGLVESTSMLWVHVPVIAVPKGNPKRISSLQDMTKSGLRIGLADPNSAAIGKASVEILNKNNLYDAVTKQVVVRSATVNELMVFISLGQVDAGIVWEDNALFAKDKVQIIPIPDEQNIIKSIAAGVLSASIKKVRAKTFIRFLHSPEVKEIFREYGFRPRQEE